MPSRHAVFSVAAVLAAFSAYFLAASPAFAHHLESTIGGWSEGWAHPFSGIDHLLAMVAIGLWAARMGGGAAWLLPATFPLFMLMGAALALSAIPLPLAEDGRAISIAVMGVLLALSAQPRLSTSAAIAALFGFCHGYAHGSEMPQAAKPLLYGLGFLAATLTLHLIGFGLGILTLNRWGQRLLPIGAAGLAGIGIALILAL